MTLHATSGARPPLGAHPTSPTTFHTVQLGGVNVFYREAGSPQHPTVVLLHGFPSASHQYQGLMDRLADRYHLIAPDYPGFGHSHHPEPAFAYTFDHLAAVVESLLVRLGLDRYSLYLQDYGGPVGLRLAAEHPERVQALILQNTNAYEEGLSPAFDPVRTLWHRRDAETEAAVLPFFALDTTVFQHTQGAADPARINPDVIDLDQANLDRPGAHAIQLDLLYDYRTNLDAYPAFQAYLREHRPPTLIPWGKNDPFFTEAGARAFLRDVPDAELHLLDAGHFALDDHADEIASLIRTFLSHHLA
ncbi:alpha/beta hydrolase (plasmid) [Deinococcus aetherius]|uniref:Alpha/beta hydrolase n=1 Tax=Deinococcus aetherius TaxID=200252 RepID=A0ABN6RPQ9_9DEIO|nr:alpha/beta hydrolase [Deinococcus aetherius]BDP43838.1 alpha/beta hydrolase [Deinococcus aetherius]